MSRKGSRAGLRGLIIGVILICLILGYYFYLSNRASRDEQEDVVQVSAVQEVLMRNLDTNYPPTPREVVKYYAQIAQCLHNETYTEEEFQELALQIQMLYDEELITNKTQDQYLSDLKWDVEQFKEQEITISSYSPSSSTDVEYKNDDYSWAKLYCTFTLRQGAQLNYSEEVFLLRKDEDEHWKIYGWKLADEEEDGQ